MKKRFHLNQLQAQYYSVQGGNKIPKKDYYLGVIPLPIERNWLAPNEFWPTYRHPSLTMHK